MKLNKNARELMQRYLLAVKRDLTGKERDDIAREIESYIYDLLEERYPETDEVDQAQLEVVLQEMGAPRKVAAQYSPNRYLIGPRLFPIYFLVAKILVAVVAGALTLSFVISAAIGQSFDGWRSVLEYLGSIWSGALSTIGMVTLIFASIEHASQGRDIEEIEELQKLKIDELPQLPEEEKEISRVGISIEIVLGVIGLAFFTYVRSTGGMVPYFFNPSTEMQLMPLFTENFMRFIPVILVLNGLEIARNLTLLVQGHHSALTNWWHILAECANVIMLGFLITSLPIIAQNAFQEIFTADIYQLLQKLSNTGLAIAMGFGIFGSVVNIIRMIGREITNPVK